MGRRRSWWAVVGPVVLMAVGALVSPPTPATVRAQGEVTVPIREFAYVPAALTVNPGTMVEWVEEDEIPHTVTVLPVTVDATGETFDSGILMHGEAFHYLFTKEGTFAYYCTLHPTMRATVIVQQPRSDEERRVDTSVRADQP